jgi:transcriptional regulator with XRE-family HTH domain
MGGGRGDSYRPIRSGLQLPAQLLAARLLAGLTQAEVARRMGTLNTAISRVETGRSAPTLVFLERFARALGRPLTLRLGLDPVPSRAERYERAERAFGQLHVYRGLLFPPEARAVGLEDDPGAECGVGDVTDFYLHKLRIAARRPDPSAPGRWGPERETADAVAAAAIWGDLIDWAYVDASIVRVEVERCLNSRVRRRAIAVIAAGIEPQWRPYDRIYSWKTPASGRRVVRRWDPKTRKY